MSGTAPAPVASAHHNAGTSAGQLQLVTFTIGGDEYAVDILKVREINWMKRITAVPNAPASVEGVINLRGAVLPVVCLRKRFGLDRSEAGERTRIMIVEVSGGVMGVIVDSVSEVLRIPADLVEPAPPLASGAAAFIEGIAKLKDRLIILLSLDGLFEHPDRSGIVYG